MNYITLGENIRKYRRFRNITQEQLAEMANISAVFLSQIENAKGKPSLETVINIANSLNVSIDILISNSQKETNKNDYIDLDLTEEQLSIIKGAFKKRTTSEISALIKAFTYLLDFDMK